MFIQTELTPNPKTVKFLPGKEVSPKKSVNFAKTDDASNSPLAKRLFLIDGVESIFFRLWFYFNNENRKYRMAGIKTFNIKPDHAALYVRRVYHWRN